MWSESSVGNTSGNRIGILNTDSTVLKAGSAREYEFAYFIVDEKFVNIKQIDYFCSKLYSKLAEKKMLELTTFKDKKSVSFYAYPNPVKAGEKMGISMKQEIAMGITLYDYSGREICKFDLPETENSIILPAGLTEGLYFVEYKTLNTTERQLIKITN